MEKTTLQKKIVIAEEVLDGIDIDDTGNFHPGLRLSMRNVRIS